MPTITGQQISDKAEIIIQDTSNIRWSTDELLGWINDCQRAICATVTGAKYTIGELTLAAGALQQLPSDGYALVRITRNANGPPVKKVPQFVLDSGRPGWYSETPTTTIQHYMYDERSPKHFHVYPPAAVGAKVVAHYSVAPTDLSTLASTIDIDDVYEPAILHYVVAHAYMKDFEASGNAERASSHLALFEKLVAAKAAAETSAAAGTVNNYKG